MLEFTKSQSAAHARLLRTQIRRSNINHNQKAVLKALVDLHIYNSFGPICPGQKKISKATGRSIRAVQGDFSLFRSWGILIPRGLLKKGSGKKTAYDISHVALVNFCTGDLDGVTSTISEGRFFRSWNAEMEFDEPTKSGPFIPNSPGQSNAKNAGQSNAKNAHPYNNYIYTNPSHGGSEPDFNVIPLTSKRGNG